jgi:hypothetical protein
MPKVRRIVLTTVVAAAVSTFVAPLANADSVPCTRSDFFIFQDRDFNRYCYANAGPNQPKLSQITHWSSGNNAGFFIWSDFDRGDTPVNFGKFQGGDLPDRSTYISFLHIDP